MSVYASPIAVLISELSRLPGIGQKSAQRLAYHILQMDTAEAYALSRAIVDAKENVRYCSKCYNFTKDDPCELCSDSRRDSSVICVVENPRDIAAMERTNAYRGLYHVLHGVISPLSAKGPEDIKLPELLKRVASEDVKEVILALNPSVEGDATTEYIAQLLKPFDVKVSRISRGIPVGGDLDYYDEMTLSLAMNNRIEFKEDVNNESERL